MLRGSSFVLTLAIALAAGQAPAPAQTAEGAASQSAAVRNDYGKPETWLCRPGRQDACAVDLTSTVINSNGSMKKETFTPAKNPPIDCFYVYPTVSLDPTPNSDMDAGPEELSVVRAQFARFGSQCRLFAPLYRQVTLTALRAGMAGKPMPADRTLGYNDVRDAWNYYLENDNNGRGVILVGHSQGSGVLTQLIRNEIEGKPVQARIISAMLIGSGIQVPKGKDAGGTFSQMPLCRAPEQTGCIVTYASFRSNVPPPANSRFGMARGENMEAACTNPAALGGGSAPLHAYLSTMFQNSPGAWVTPEKPVDTPFVSLPGLLTGECVSNERGSYLAVTVHGNPADPRIDDIPGDVVTNGKVQQDWGLHLIDVHLAMGNLVELAGRQAKAYLSKRSGGSGGR